MDKQPGAQGSSSDMGDWDRVDASSADEPYVRVSLSDEHATHDCDKADCKSYAHDESLGAWEHISGPFIGTNSANKSFKNGSSNTINAALEPATLRKRLLPEKIVELRKKKRDLLEHGTALDLKAIREPENSAAQEEAIAWRLQLEDHLAELNKEIEEVLMKSNQKCKVEREHRGD